MTEIVMRRQMVDPLVTWACTGTAVTYAMYFVLAIGVKNVEPPRFGWTLSILGALLMALLPTIVLKHEREYGVAFIGASFGFVTGLANLILVLRQ